jgi:hypothetical protein
MRGQFLRKGVHPVPSSGNLQLPQVVEDFKRHVDRRHLRRLVGLLVQNLLDRQQTGILHPHKVRHLLRAVSPLGLGRPQAVDKSGKRGDVALGHCDGGACLRAG